MITEDKVTVFYPLPYTQYWMKKMQPCQKRLKKRFDETMIEANLYCH